MGEGSDGNKKAKAKNRPGANAHRFREGSQVGGFSGRVDRKTKFTTNRGQTLMNTILIIFLSAVASTILWRLFFVEKKLLEIEIDLKTIRRDAASVNFLHEQLGTIIAKMAEQNARPPRSEELD